MRKLSLLRKIVAVVGLVSTGIWLGTSVSDYPMVSSITCASALCLMGICACAELFLHFRTTKHGKS